MVLTGCRSKIVESGIDLRELERFRRLAGLRRLSPGPTDPVTQVFTMTTTVFRQTIECWNSAMADSLFSPQTQPGSDSRRDREESQQYYDADHTGRSCGATAT